MLDRKLLLGTTVIAGFVAALAVATPTVSFAQTTPPATTADDEDDTEVEALVVTGSRIKRSEFTSSAPIQVITAESSSLEGLIDTTEILQQSSLASGSFQVNNQLTGFVTDGGPGVNTISLRGLGATRTLVLLNGRRVGPAGTRGTVGPVDLNVIPNSIVERFEILKDGASSIYGSDAVAGVINIITKSNFDGIELNASAIQPFEAGGETYRVSAAWGKTFDRGYVNVAADYYEQKVLRRGDRDDTACASDYLLAGGPNGAPIDFPNTDPGQGYGDDTAKCYNLFTRAINTGLYGTVIHPDAGVIYPTAAQGNSGGAVFGSTAVPFGLVRQGRAGFPATFPYAHQDHPAYARASILSPVKRTSVFATAGFDLTASTELYAELLINRRESAQYGARQFFPSFSTANPNNPYGATLGSLLPIIPLKSDRLQEVNYWRGVIGMRGDFGSMLSGWDWDIFYQRSSSDADYTTDIIYNDRVVATTGALACNQAAITISGGQCTALPTGLPWVSPRIINGDFNAAEQAFLFTQETGNTTYTQDAVEFTTTGTVFNLPAGPVGAAIGVAWRKDEINDTPGLNERSGNLWGSTSAGITKGDDTVSEVFGEIEIPVFKGLPGIESLDVQLSGRYTDYESYGDGSTYKLGFNWQITPGWRIRGTKGTSFRAPALYELYLANQTSFLGQTAIDPCINYVTSSNATLAANCAADGVPLDYVLATSYGGGSSATVTVGGGAGVLSAETSEAKTLGVIWTPDFIDLSVAVDYFEILVENQISRFGAANSIGQCYRNNPFPGPFCTLFTRDPVTFNITAVFDGYLNVAEQVNTGIDLTTRYQHTFDMGRLTIDTQFTWTFEDETALLVGTTTDSNGETGDPDFTGSINTRFDSGDWTFAWSVDLIGKSSDTEDFGADVFNSTRYASNCRVGAGPIAPCSTLIGTGNLTVQSVPVYYKQYNEFTAYHDFSVRRKMDTWTFQAGILNVFDDRPPAQSAGQFRIGTAGLNQFDMTGRRAFFGITKRW